MFQSTEYTSDDLLVDVDDELMLEWFLDDAEIQGRRLITLPDGCVLPETIDLAYVATLDDRFLLAVMNGIAAYRGKDFSTEWAFALRAVTR